VPPRHLAPIRRRLTVLKDGTIESCELVFCEGCVRSVRVSRCEACPFAPATVHATEGDGGVDCGCSIWPIGAEDPDVRFPPAVAAALPVGLALGQSIACVEDDLPWLAAMRVPVLRASLSGIPVVDHGGSLLGILPAPGITLAAAGAPPDPCLRVADCAQSLASVHEAQSLSDAFATMGARHARELPVVGEGGSVVGLLRDVDALRFVAHVARTGKRPTSPPLL
jgi:CBS domain-containing protein